LEAFLEAVDLASVPAQAAAAFASPEALFAPRKQEN